MKKLFVLLLSLASGSFFVCSWFSRYQPVSLSLKAPASITCEIKGEVAWPGVYTLANGSTIGLLIEEAGGSLESGDTSALALLEPLQSNQVVVIPKKKEKPKLSINTASLEDLCELPGIGPSLAQRIVDYRADQSFDTLEQLKEVKGIGDKLFQKIEELICL